MNNRFKFRVWDKRKKQYADRYVIGVDGWAYQLHDAGEDSYDLIPDEDVIIEQCTGLTDKNGKLIYEGDVVVVPNQYPYFDYADGVQHKSLNDTYCVIEHDAVPNYVGVVEWYDESAQFVIVLRCVNPSKSGISNGMCYTFDESSNWEIIGNVHAMEVEE